MAVSANCARDQSIVPASIVNSKSCISYYLLVVIQQLCSHEIGLSTLFGVGTEKIREEENLQNDKDDEKLDGYDQPQRLPQRHAAEAIIIKVEGTVKETALSHRHLVFSLRAKIGIISQTTKRKRPKSLQFNKKG